MFFCSCCAEVFNFVSNFCQIKLTISLQFEKKSCYAKSVNLHNFSFFFRLQCFLLSFFSLSWLWLNSNSVIDILFILHVCFLHQDSIVLKFAFAKKEIAFDFLQIEKEKLNFYNSLKMTFNTFYNLPIPWRWQRLNL